jgi:probable HAF family extracellular repeat protein
MKSLLTSIAAATWLATFALAQPARYNIIDLGLVGGTPGQPYVITNNGFIAGAAASGGAMQAVLWYGAFKINIGGPGKGPNSAAFNVNESGQVVGQAETSVPDPNKEDFCGFNAYGWLTSFSTCRPFVWQYGVPTLLPTLGGHNGWADGINNRGDVAGLAENGKPDPNPACPVSQFEPVIWTNDVAQELRTWADDTDGVAAWINDYGQAVGASGTCGSFNPGSGLYLVEDHALLWESDGSVHDLGDLGGTGGAPGYFGNHACAINNQGQVVGHSALPGDMSAHAFLWENGVMKDLGTLRGDFASFAVGINDNGVVVGTSVDATFTTSNAVLWENGAPVNLNTRIASNPGKLSLQAAASINFYGEIVGFAVTSSGAPHGFLAIPTNGVDD